MVTLAGWMETRFKVQLLISTLLLNYVAVLFAGYLVSEPFQDKSGSAALAQTPMIDQVAWLPKLFQGMSVHMGLVIAIVVAIILFIILRFTSAGYEVRMLGYNPFLLNTAGLIKQRCFFTACSLAAGSPD